MNNGPQNHPRWVEEPVTSVADGFTSDGVQDTHPAFGVAVVTRSTGTPRALFQSDVLHNETITLSIHQADRTRDLNHDWVHPRDELIEVEMSLAQWGALVSSIGIGSGVPVTLRRTEAVRFVPRLPYQPRIKTSLDEVNKTIAKMLGRARTTIVALTDAIENKAGVRVVRQALSDHTRSIEYAEGNSKFAVESMARAAESVASQAKADIESQVLNAARLTGLTANVQVPELMGPSNQALSIEACADTGLADTGRAEDTDNKSAQEDA